jgi:hypothetical protein
MISYHKNLDMKTIVFDMDETLLHCKDQTELNKFKGFTYDHIVRFKLPELSP